MNISSENGMIGLICVGAFFIIVCFFLLLSAFQARKRKNGFTAAIGQLGFAAQTQPDADLLVGLQRLFEPARVNHLKNVAVKLMGDEKYYLFDITYTSPQYSNHSSSSVNTEFNNVAILSPYLDLPPFILLNRMKMPGALAGLADSVLIYGAASAGFSEYKQVPPVFQMNYMLFVKDDPRVATAFTDELLNRIGMLDNVVGRGEGRLLMLNRFDFRASSKLDVNKLSDQVNLLRRFTDWLAE